MNGIHYQSIGICIRGHYQLFCDHHNLMGLNIKK